jgi:hypothetical protein
MKRILLLFLLTSCISTEVYNEVIPVDTVYVKPKRELPKNTTQIDTARVPITFNPTVQDWETKEPSGTL